jgi:hypothetical protein
VFDSSFTCEFFAFPVLGISVALNSSGRATHRRWMPGKLLLADDLRTAVILVFATGHLGSSMEIAVDIKPPAASGASIAQQGGMPPPRAVLLMSSDGQLGDASTAASRRRHGVGDVHGKCWLLLWC